MKTTTDTLLLAASCPINDKASVLDVGCGDGGLSLALSQRVSSARLVGVDVSVDAVSQANINVPYGQFHTADVLDWKRSDLHNQFDVVVSNPPYFSRPDGHKSPDQARETARGASDEALSDWVNTCWKFVTPLGWLSLIGPSQRLATYMSCLDGKASRIIILPIQTKQTASPSRLIFLVRKPSKKVVQPDLDFLHPLPFFGEQRDEVEDMLKANQLSLWAHLRAKGMELPQVLQKY